MPRARRWQPRTLAGEFLHCIGRPMLGRASLGGGPDGQYFNAQKQDSDSKYRQGQLYGYPNSHHQPHRDSSGELEIGPALAVDHQDFNLQTPLLFKYAPASQFLLLYLDHWARAI